MGLPSGTMWASRNIDVNNDNGFAASMVQYMGSFFSWGNLDGHNPNENDSFGEWSWGSSTSQEPYVSSAGALLTSDIDIKNDAARVHCGTPWVMPSLENYRELFDGRFTEYIDADGDVIDDSVSDKRISIDGVVGIRLRSKINGNIIFFPLCGEGSQSTLSYKGSSTHYWTRSYNNISYAQAPGLGDVISIDVRKARYLGYAVRPVFKIA